MTRNNDVETAARAATFEHARVRERGNLLPSCDPVRIYFLANTRLAQHLNYPLTMANFIRVERTGESSASPAARSVVSFRPDPLSSGNERYVAREEKTFSMLKLHHFCYKYGSAGEYRQLCAVAIS